MHGAVDFPVIPKLCSPSAARPDERFSEALLKTALNVAQKAGGGGGPLCFTRTIKNTCCMLGSPYSDQAHEI